ncbi:MAG: alpha/beta fold hydrolase [Planctomycetota bacterium]
MERLDRELVLSDGERTKVDFRHPENASPSGWPIVVIVHGGGGDRHYMSVRAHELAARGYFTVAYDLRGHGDHSGFNTHTGPRERKDLGEVIVFASADSAADGSRVGVMGTSMGGMHAWIAAAWDGEPYEDGSGAFPDIDVVVSENASPDFRANFAPQANGIHCTDFTTVIGSAVRHDPALTAAALAALVDEDYAAWAEIVAGPAMNPWPRLPSVTCAVMSLGAFDDYVFPAGVDAAGWSALPASTPKKLYLGTGGHRSPSNDAEAAFRRDWCDRWLDRWLKDADNGIDDEPAVAYVVTPDDAAAYVSPAANWARRTSDTWPPVESTSARWYLREAGALSLSAPIASEAAESITQTIEPGFTVEALASAGFKLAVAEAGISRVSIAYESDALGADLHYAGGAQVHLSVSCAQTRWQLRARLVDVPPAGAEPSAPRYVAGGSHFAFDDVASGASTVEVTIAANAYVFRAGHKLRLELENLQVHEPPLGRSLRFVPYFQPFTLEVQHGAGSESWLDLPVLSVPDAVTAFCFGDGVSSACPCDNSGESGRGCANSRFAAGAVLGAVGAPQLTADSFRLDAHDMSGNSCIFFQRDARSAAVAVDDGLGCTSGVLIRFGVRPVVGGSASYPSESDAPISIAGLLGATGGTRHYQCLYRDPDPRFCTPATTNRTNGLTVVWAP